MSIDVQEARVAPADPPSDSTSGSDHPAGRSSKAPLLLLASGLVAFGLAMFLSGGPSPDPEAAQPAFDDPEQEANNEDTQSFATPSGPVDWATAIFVEELAPAPRPIQQRATVDVASLSPSGPIDLRDQDEIVIEGLQISNPDGPCILIEASSNITIRNNSIGPCGEHAIRMENVGVVNIDANEFVNTGTGIYALTSSEIAVTNNHFQDAGRNYVQLDKVNGPNTIVDSNWGGNALGESNAEDLVNIYQSNGTAESPITVTNNDFWNGGPSRTGSGIMAGDDGGSYQYIANNTLTNPGQAGIGVASGTNITVENNRIFGEGSEWSNVGVYAWEQYGRPCGDVTIRNNLVNWTNRDGQPNGWWNGGGCGEPEGLSRNSWSSTFVPSP